MSESDISVKCKQEFPLNEDVSCLLGALGEEKTWRWCVYWYESYGYDGSGMLVACDESGDLYSCDLGHCSCYSPGDGGVTYDRSLASWLESVEVLDAYGYGIDAKIRELCQSEAANETI
jgi:hypothetical protein